MILQRLATSIRRQDWFTVLIETLIVVLGVFLGIQLGNWNEARNDRAREQEYYVQILKDLRSGVEMAQITFNTARIFDEHGDYLDAALEDPSFEIEEPDYFVLSVARAGYVRFPVINRHTINELESIGGLTLLSDRQVKNAILDYYDFASNSSQWNELLRAQQLIYKNAHIGLLSREVEREIATKISTFEGDLAPWEQLKADFGPEGLGVDVRTAEEILQEARMRPDFPGALATMEVVHSRLELRAALIEERAEALIAIIEEHIGATPSPADVALREPE